MGKIADALERHKKEKATKVEFLRETKPVKPMQTVNDEKEIALAKEFCTLYDCSPNVVVLSEPNSADAENFKILRAQVLFGKRRKKARTIMVTSSFPGEGKTFVTVNLAVSLALGIDEHVLLMDCDLRRPQVHEILGYKNGGGLHECLTGKRPLEEVITRTAIDKLSILTAGRPPANPSELLSSATMRSFLEQIKQRYKDRFVIIDSAPSNITAEAKVLAEYVDEIIFVIMAGKSQRKDIQRAIQNFGRKKILGIVLNGYSQASKHYQKHYKNYYEES